jgi:hypothetical protein
MKKVFRNVKFFLIWFLNSIFALRLSTEFKPYQVAIIVFVWVVFLVGMQEGFGL